MIKILNWLGGNDINAEVDDLHVNYGLLSFCSNLLTAIPLTYCLDVLFDELHILVSIVLGVLFSFMMMSLDRIFFRSYDVLRHNRSAGLSFAEFFKGMPRLIIACVWALTLSICIESQVFAKEINKQLEKQNLEYDNSLKSGAEEMKSTAYQNIETKIQSLNNDADQIRNQILGLDSLITAEESRVGCGQKCKDLKKYRVILQSRKDSIDHSLKIVAADKRKISEYLDNLADQFSKTLDHSFWDKVSALNNVSNGVMWLIWLIRFGLILLFSLPLLAKMIYK